MPTRVPIHRHIAAPVCAALILALAATQALAQGTDEQREACAPDAVKLCSDTIPDIPKTTACMKAHFRQLSPRCKTAFLAVTGPTRAGPAAAGAEPDGRGGPLPGTREAPVAVAPAPVPGSVAAYRADIARDCAAGLIDPFTCKSTMDVLGGAE